MEVNDKLEEKRLKVIKSILLESSPSMICEYSLDKTKSVVINQYRLFVLNYNVLELKELFGDSYIKECPAVVNSLIYDIEEMIRKIPITIKQVKVKSEYVLNEYINADGKYLKDIVNMMNLTSNFELEYYGNKKPLLYHSDDGEIALVLPIVKENIKEERKIFSNEVFSHVDTPSLANEMLNNYNIYKKFVEPAYIQEFERKHEDIVEDYKRFYLSLLNDINNRSMYNNELKKKKIDPYIAGGAASGVAGIGAGVISYASASENNSNIDHNRNVLENEVRNSSIDLNGKQGYFYSNLERYNKYLNSFYKIFKYRVEFYEKEYEENVQKVEDPKDINEIYQLIKYFTSMNNYKESKNF